MAIAISASVTVSMGEETSGAFKVKFLVSLDPRFTSSAEKSMYPGRIMKSLKWNIIINCQKIIYVININI